MNIHLASVGCRVNQSEIEMMARQFTAAGHGVVADPIGADVCVVNSCAVTLEAERKSRRRIRTLARINPRARIAVVGCYATLAPRLCANLPGVAWVVPNAEKACTVNLVCPPALPAGRENDETALRTRAFVKVQDGCDNHCTYCVVRLLRGAARSRPLGDIVADVQARVAAGCREAVLTGVNLGAYGRDLGLAGGLRTLVTALLAHTDLARLRLSSVEPWDLDASFFRLWEDARLCRQLHLPLQAGCDDTLRRMGRPITTAEFVQLVKAARAVMPDVAVTTDVIVGFPGEDDAAFRASRDLISAIAFARLHVFSFSARPGTPAARLPDRVPRAERDARAREMRALGAEQALCFRRRFVGREMTVLWERRRTGGGWAGWTDNYVRVVAHAEADLHNRLTSTRLLAVHDGYVKGEVIGV